MKTTRKSIIVVRGPNWFFVPWQVAKEVGFITLLSFSMMGVMSYFKIGSLTLFQCFSIILIVLFLLRYCWYLATRNRNVIHFHILSPCIQIVFVEDENKNNREESG